MAALALNVSGTAPNQTYATWAYLIYTDHLNTPRVITQTSNGAIRWRWDQADPFGLVPPNENPSGLGTFAFNLRMPGQYYDRESNLFYNYFRDYDSQLGRYVQSDPIGLQGGANTYGYVGANPMARTDPAGLDVVCVGPFCRYTPPAPPPASSTAVPSPSDPASYDDDRSRSRDSDASRRRDSNSSKANNCPPSKEDCDKQWIEARLVCRSLIYEQMQQRAGRRKKRSVTGVTGGYTDVEECARGLVSEECGGNKKAR